MATPDDGPPLGVVFAHPDLLVVDKPANCVVVAGRGAPRPTLTEQVRAQGHAKAKPVHRLDRGTTGCCVFSLTPHANHTLQAAFKAHKVDKRYLALVQGVPRFKSLDVDAPLLRVDTPNARKGPLAHQEVSPEGVRARTHLKVLQKGQTHALLLCQPQTGRMHQIRAHLGHLGYPIVGDALYGAVPDERVQPHRLGLHAWMIAFPDPKGQRRFVVASIDTWWGALLDDVQLSAAKLSPMEEGFRSRARSESTDSPSRPGDRNTARSSSGTKTPSSRPSKRTRPGARSKRSR